MQRSVRGEGSAKTILAATFSEPSRALDINAPNVSRHQSFTASKLLFPQGRSQTRVRSLFEPRHPSLAIFSSVAVASTLFLGLVIGLMLTQVLGEVSSGLAGFILVIVALPIALSVTTFLSLILPYRAFVSTSTPISVVASYTPYAAGAIAGIAVALWLARMLPLDYEPLPGVWMTFVGISVTVTWLLTGWAANHLAAMVERRRGYERGLEENRESRHRMMMIHEQTRKEVAGLLHGRVQSRLLIVRHWLKDCHSNLNGASQEVKERLENANTLLQEISDQDLRSTGRQLYPSIIRIGLPGSLNSLGDRFRSVFDVDLQIGKELEEMETPGASGLSDPLRLAIYRVVEEALGNVVKHSEASSAKVRLNLSPNKEILLEVIDNGCGFVRSKLPTGQGLLSIEDYVTAFGGAVEIESLPGVGTTIKARVPITNPQNHQEDSYLKVA